MEAPIAAGRAAVAPERAKTSNARNRPGVGRGGVARSTPKTSPLAPDSPVPDPLRPLTFISGSSATSDIGLNLVEDR
jgi:hypothetical protein